MSKKKKNKKTKDITKHSVTPVAERLGSIDAGASISERVNSVIAKMTAPPETIIDHLKRVGVEFVTDQMALDGGEPRVYVLIDYHHMVEKELENIRKGGVFKDEYPVKPKAELNPISALFTKIAERAKEINAENESKEVQLKTFDGNDFVDEPDDKPKNIVRHVHSDGTIGTSPNCPTVQYDDYYDYYDYDDDDDYPIGGVQG